MEVRELLELPKVECLHSVLGTGVHELVVAGVDKSVLGGLFDETNEQDAVSTLFELSFLVGEVVEEDLRLVHAVVLLSDHLRDVEVVID